MNNPLRAGAALALALLATSCALDPAPAQTDDFRNFTDSVSGPCRDWAAIVPSDTVALARALDRLGRHDQYGWRGRIDRGHLDRGRRAAPGAAGQDQRDRHHRYQHRGLFLT